MPFAFRKMQVYQLSRSLAAELAGVSSGLGRPHWRAGDQLMRAALSIMLNIAEGAGEYRPAEKARFYRMARRSCYETCAAVDHLASVGLLTPTEAADLEQRLDYIAGSLTRLVRSLGTPA